MTDESTIAADRAGRRLPIQRLVPALLVASVPVALALCNDEWLFTPAGETDPWWYVGAGYHFDNPDYSPDNYKVSRLPWILAQFAARHLLTPATAAYVLTLGFLVPGAIGFYLVAGRLFGTGAGIAGAVLLSTYTQYLVSRATDYHNTPAGPFYIWSFLLATMGAQADRHSRRLFFLSGIFFGLAVHTGFFFLFLAPGFLVHLWLLQRSHQGPRLSVSVATGATGAMAATVGLALINAAFGRGFFFFLPQLQYMAGLATARGQQYLSGFYQDDVLSRVYGSPWVLGMRHLALPLVATLMALGLAAAAMRARRRSTEVSSLQWFTLSASLQMLLASAIWVLQETRHSTGLVVDFMSYPLIIPAFLVVTSGFSRVFGPGRLSAVWQVLIAAAAAAPLVFNGWLGEVVGPWVLPAWPAVAPFLFYGGALLAIVLLGRHARTPAVGLALVAVFGVGHAFSIHQFNGLLRTGDVGLRAGGVQTHARRDASLSVVDLQLRLARVGLERVQLWWDGTESIENGAGGSISLTYIAGSALRTGVRGFGDPPPGIDQISSDDLQALIAQDHLVAVITRNSATADRMLARLRELGDWRRRREETIDHGGIRFQLIWLGPNPT